MRFAENCSSHGKNRITDVAILDPTGDAQI